MVINIQNSLSIMLNLRIISHRSGISSIWPHHEADCPRFSIVIAAKGPFQ